LHPLVFGIPGLEKVFVIDAVVIKYGEGVNGDFLAMARASAGVMSAAQADVSASTAASAAGDEVLCACVFHLFFVSLGESYLDE